MNAGRKKTHESNLLDIAIVQGLANDKSVIQIASEVGLKTIAVQLRLYRLRHKHGFRHLHTLVAHYHKLKLIK